MTNQLLNQYFEKQALLSAVENFSTKHDMREFTSDQKMYKELLPSRTPKEDQQYAFEVDLDKCTGCKACVTACHNENGLDEGETWRTVGMIQGGTSTNPAIQHITTACHHCAEPACMDGCPTKAYTKDPHTGVVKHLDDQCFGCQYCILKCPYDVPKYNKDKGIVHKCDMCISRLNVGQAPACVRACPTGAIRITVVDKNDVKVNQKEYVDVPDSPASNYTYPTTIYKSKKKLPENMVSYDYFNIVPEHSHLPLVLMLVLTQLSVGAFLIDIFLMQYVDSSISLLTHNFHTLVALCIGLFALGASILHLGRPQYAFRAVLGLRTSWLSREILSFGIFAKLAVFYGICLMFSGVKSFIINLIGVKIFAVLPYCIVLFGLIGIYCSVMVYKDTRRPFWDNQMTTSKFFLTMAILGLSTILISSIVYATFTNNTSTVDIINAYGRTACIGILCATIIKLLIESTVFLTLYKSDLTFIKKTAILMTNQLCRSTQLRYIFAVLGGIIFPLSIFSINVNAPSFLIVMLCGFIFLFNVAAEFMERYLFFKAVVPLKMPGGQLS